MLYIGIIFQLLSCVSYIAKILFIDVEQISF